MKFGATDLPQMTEILKFSLKDSPEKLDNGASLKTKDADSAGLNNEDTDGVDVKPLPTFLKNRRCQNEDPDVNS